MPMPSKQKIEEILKEPVSQVWQENAHAGIYRDQYGHEIYKTGDTYVLYRKQQRVVEVNKLHTAKVISKIIVNDIINYKKLEK